ncbi:ribonuclease H-like domain-containing protein [Tanacetum coccineum]
MLLGSLSQINLSHKDFISLVENQLNNKVKAIRCDNGTEFKNAKLIELCGEKGIKRDYSNARTTQQNGVAERKNKTLIEAARTMLADSKLPTMFWTEAVRLLISSLFKPFGCHVTILNTSDHLGKFDGKADEGYLLGYSAIIRVLQGYNRDKANQSAGTQDVSSNPAGFQDDDSDSDSDEQVILMPEEGKFQKRGSNVANKHVPPGSIPVPTGSIPILSGDTMVSPSDVSVPIGDVPVPSGSPTDSFFDAEPITRFSNPSDLGNNVPSHGIFSSTSYDDEFGAHLNNLASTVEVSPVATKRINTVHPQSLIIGEPNSSVQTRSQVHKKTTGETAFLSYIQDQQRNNHTDFQHCLFACFLSQVEPRSVAQALEDPTWVDAMQRGHPLTRPLVLEESTKEDNHSWVQVYVDDSSLVLQEGLCVDEFEALMKEILNEGTAIHPMKPQSNPIIEPDKSFSPCSRNQVTPTTSNLEAVKKIFKYLKGQPKLGLWYPRESPFVLKAYSDSDYAGANKDRKSTIGGCQFLGRRLISWQCKKQTITATSSTEAEYVAAANCCGQTNGSRSLSVPSGVPRVPTGSFIFPTG